VEQGALLLSADAGEGGTNARPARRQSVMGNGGIKWQYLRTWKRVRHGRARGDRASSEGGGEDEVIRDMDGRRVATGQQEGPTGVTVFGVFGWGLAKDGPCLASQRLVLACNVLSTPPSYPLWPFPACPFSSSFCLFLRKLPLFYFPFFA